MFRNSGKKITVVVKVLFWLNLLLALAGAAAVVCYAYSGYGVEMALMAALAAAAAVVCYMLLMYVALLVLNAFGELAQSNLEIRRILAENRRTQEQPAYVPPAPFASERTPAPQEAPKEESFPDWPDLDFQVSVRPAPAPVPAPAPAPAPAEPPKEPAPKTAPFGMVYCRRCGAKHEPGVDKCRYCGTPLY